MLNLDQSLTDAMNGMNKANGIELPFPAPVLWVLNGQPAAKVQGGAGYFGGWSADANGLDKLLSETGRQAPFGFTRTTQASRDGNEYDTLITRYVHVACIAKRESWLLDNRRTPEYVDGARRHLQVLAMLANLDEATGTFMQWGPVVLSAKGFQAKNLLAATTQWEQGTAPVRRAIAPKISPWFFWISIGTFGDKREVTNVGKAGAQSPITPIKLHLPDVTEAFLTKRFVGQEVARVIVELSQQAGEWLNAWREPVEEQGQNGKAQPNMAQPMGTLDL